MCGANSFITRYWYSVRLLAAVGNGLSHVVHGRRALRDRAAERGDATLMHRRSETTPIEALEELKTEYIELYELADDLTDQDLDITA